MTAPLKVGIDARMVYYRQAGIGQYVLNLLREMAEINDSRLSLKVFQSRKEPNTPDKWLGYNFPGCKLWTPPHHRLEQLALPIEMAISGLDVLHSPDFIPPFFRMTWNGIKPSRYASVITIHDLAFLQFPHLLTAESAGYYGQVNHAASSADLIIAVSQSTAQDIETHLGISRQKIRVVYEAANPLYRPLSESELSVMAGKEASKVVEKLAEKRLTPKDSFLLFVSTIEPRKNLPTLLKAFRAMLDELPESDQPMLVIAGREGWLFQDVYNLAQDLKLGKQLVWLGGVSTEELLWLYNKAALLAMPSFYEGFGLPPLESLACGTPVLVADTSSLPEVIGDIGQKIPPLEVKRWKEALLTGWQQRENWKAEALTRGPAQAAKFSWRKAAQETLEIYIEAKNSLRKRNRR